MATKIDRLGETRMMNCFIVLKRFQAKTIG